MTATPCYPVNLVQIVQNVKIWCPQLAAPKFVCAVWCWTHVTLLKTSNWFRENCKKAPMVAPKYEQQIDRITNPVSPIKYTF